MAIDSAAKRYSAMQAFNPVAFHVPLPDGDVDQGDRQTLAGFYRGIPAGVLVLVVGLMRITFRVIKPTMSFLGFKPTMTFAAKKPTMSFLGFKPTVSFVPKKPSITFHEEG